MAVPKRFKFKTKKLMFNNINNNCTYIKPLINEYLCKDLKIFFRKKKEKQEEKK